MTGTVSEADQRLEAEFLSNHPGASTAPLESLETSEQVEIFTRQPVAVMLPVWERLSPDIARKLLTALPESIVVETMQGLDPVRLAHLLTSLDEDAREHLLGLIDEGDAKEVRSAMLYPPDRAGALMDSRARLLRQSSTVAEVLRRLRRDRRPGRSGFFVVDSDNRLAGWVDIQDLALAEPEERVGDLVRDVDAVVDPMATGEDVAEKMDAYRLSDLAVVDLDGRLTGVIRHAARVEAERERASLGIQTMVGVSKDERATSTVSFAVRRRLPWLHVNLLTAFIAAAVVGLFENTIAQFTALAVLLPVVAGQSGNTGAQALAVTMRGLTLREIRVAQWGRVVLKEAIVGFWNGIAIALTTAVGVILWSGSYGLGLIIAASMVLSVIIAGVSGALIPIVLRALGQDPAQSSSILLTTITDVVAFLSFLGIATLLSGLI
ncbi:MAG: magnesium transporter [Deltaproteobacteria bacterium]|nr:magnesium transporter [Deltaproteobacteria bacterium]